MRETPLILIVDDQPDNRNILSARLSAENYATAEAVDGEDALRKINALRPDLILLDVMMPNLDGFEVCRRVRSDDSLPFIPIVIVTARSDLQDMVIGLEAGANDYLTKPVDQTALVARVRSMLKIKALHDEVQIQKQELADWNTALEERVSRQVQEIERANRLKRFLPRQVADEVLTAGAGEEVLASRRAYVTVLFADLRGFSSFAEQSSPDVVMKALNAFHECAGPLIERYEGTLERFLGDGIVVLFNAPLAVSDQAGRAAGLAGELHAAVQPALEPFSRNGDSDKLGLGIGIATGETTVGKIGFEGRTDFAAIGPVPNLAARLCENAETAETLLDSNTVVSLGDKREVTPLGERTYKGFSQAIQVFRA